MEDKSFIWTPDLTRRFFELRFENDLLFKKLKQPWGEFHKILQENGFPEDMTVSHVRKKWSYTYDAYRTAKRAKNKDWKYYKMFDKHFGKTKVLDKYESWDNEWRLKLILCVSEAMEMKIDFHNLWRVVESALRCQDLPIDCCIQDIKELWQYIKTTFNRKHRLKLKRGEDSSEWPLYDTMLEYFRKYEKDYLDRLENDSCMDLSNIKSKLLSKRKTELDSEEGSEFQWSKNITESFIQIRLQQDWLFRQRKWAWNKLRNIMIEEYGFPETLTSRDLRKKWAWTFADYQKAVASGNRSWVYYRLFELHLGDGTLSLNPLKHWQEEWVLNVISARAELDHLFQAEGKERHSAWRDVEKKLRTVGIPLDHSLLDLEEIWIHLIKTYKWKLKFANKGILNEQWPYFDAMSKYMQTRVIPRKPMREEYLDDDFDGVDNDDDMKLLDLKEKWSTHSTVRPKHEPSLCRACSSEEGCVSIFDERDDDGVDLAIKLKVVGGIEVERGDSLPSQICLTCLKELDAAYKFRRKCQDVDKHLRDTSIKTEIKHDTHELHTPDIDDYDDHQTQPIKVEKPRRKKVRRPKYEYWKVCEVCGKHTKNLLGHLDTHASDKVYSCDVCQKKFKFKSGLVVHKAVHNPTPKKTCEVCGKTFHIMASYRRHFVYHANERKYSCETCGKRFNTMDILKVHTRMHTDERPFSCSECGKTFRTAGCVSRHKRIVHKNVKQ
ncbi:uncharacterized protein LOC121735577 [Aricia agestis]|uniref:uncharacterized protein LOC121735577 n=1 Tax=Aricia agestis TaxID=91739 RepID=UPI001C20BB64|nr:uncharacterized protein LOC121735577 [Aricia agestis]